MMLSKQTALSFIAVFVAILSVSCSSNLPPRPAGMPDPVPCTITVQDESGSPIVAAMVRLLPVSGSQWGASGATDAQGNATFKTEGLFPGIVPGSYKVMISKTETISTGKYNEAEGYEITETKTLIDAKFGSISTTPFTIDVPAGGISETFKVAKPGK